VGIYFFRRYFLQKSRLSLEEQNLQEKLNVLTDQNLREYKNLSSLNEKFGRYSSLKNIIEEINQNLSLDFVADSLVDIVFSQIAGHKGTCILYLVDSQAQKPMIFKTRKEDKNLMIKAKEGDIFDFWVLRHMSPLLIEDTRKDYRFDLDKFKTDSSRSIASLISVPFLSEHRQLGIIRLESRGRKLFRRMI